MTPSQISDLPEYEELAISFSLPETTGRNYSSLSLSSEEYLSQIIPVENRSRYTEVCRNDRLSRLSSDCTESEINNIQWNQIYDSRNKDLTNFYKSTAPGKLWSFFMYKPHTLPWSRASASPQAVKKIKHIENCFSLGTGIPASFLSQCQSGLKEQKLIHAVSAPVLTADPDILINQRPSLKIMEILLNPIVPAQLKNKTNSNHKMNKQVPHSKSSGIRRGINACSIRKETKKRMSEEPDNFMHHPLQQSIFTGNKRWHTSGVEYSIGQEIDALYIWNSTILRLMQLTTWKKKLAFTHAAGILSFTAITTDILSHMPLPPHMLISGPLVPLLFLENKRDIAFTCLYQIMHLKQKEYSEEKMIQHEQKAQNSIIYQTSVARSMFYSGAGIPLITKIISKMAGKTDEQIANLINNRNFRNGVSIFAEIRSVSWQKKPDIRNRISSMSFKNLRLASTAVALYRMFNGHPEPEDLEFSIKQLLNTILLLRKCTPVFMEDDASTVDQITYHTNHSISPISSFTADEIICLVHALIKKGEDFATEFLIAKDLTGYILSDMKKEEEELWESITKDKAGLTFLSRSMSVLKQNIYK